MKEGTAEVGESSPLLSGRYNFNSTPLEVKNLRSKNQHLSDALKAYKKSIFDDSEKDEREKAPTPDYKECSPIPLKAIKMSSQLHVYRVLTADEQQATVEYEIDDLDELWLKAIDVQKGVKIDREIFVRIIDRLEKESTFQPKRLPEFIEHSCCICEMEHDEDSNRTIYCDLCNIGVHQECYGVPFIPEGSWYCRRCKISPSAPVSCVMCPNKDGAFKPTSDQRWIHVICAIWLDELYFLNSVFLEPVEGIKKCLKIRSKMECMICKKKIGACIRCSHKGCKRAFHVTCAQAASIYMKVEDPDGSRMDVQFFSYCHMHNPNDKEVDVPVKRRKMEEACEVACKTLKKKKNYNLPISMPKISKEKIKNIANHFLCNEYIKEVVDFWFLKRNQRFGMPLIPRLQQEVELRSIEAEHITLENPLFEELRLEHDIIRNDLKRQRMLWKLVKKRENLKMNYVIETQKIFELQYSPTELLFGQILQELEQEDRSRVFIESTENVVPSYRWAITKPMDIQTMKNKLMEKKYSTIADIQKDLELICANCENFNTNFNNEFYIEYGRNYLKKSLKIIKNYQERLDLKNSIFQRLRATW